MIILGIETSCDETSAAVLKNGQALSNVISSQHVHAKYGGVVPELASRAHQRLIIEVVDEAMNRAGVNKSQLEAVAVTCGPGLVGSLLVGLTFGKALAFGRGIPVIGINHMEGHLYSMFLNKPVPDCPFLCLIVSGGHTMLVHVEDILRHTILGQTRDDAAGEAFDKVAKMLGLGYPGGPVVDRLAKKGDPSAIHFPRTFLENGPFDFSFSGIKTSVLYYLKQHGMLSADLHPSGLDEQVKADICASFQAAVVEMLTVRTFKAAEYLGVKTITLAGGVSANSQLREQSKAEAEKRGYALVYPPLEYCMDNAAMIAYAGWLRLARGESSSLDISATANLPLARQAMIA